MNREAISNAFFDEYYIAPEEQTVERISCSLPSPQTLVDRMKGSIVTAGLIAVLECLCARELQRCLKTYDEAPVAMQMHCGPCAPLVVGSRIRMTGWVEQVGDRDVTFRVKAQDEHEQVCDGRIQFALVPRAEIAQTLSRKREAVTRREMFAPA